MGRIIALARPQAAARTGGTTQLKLSKFLSPRPAGAWRFGARMVK
ncbi:MAG: hypothetical protein WEC36_10840 [Phycisphaeraceae bacterium]